MTNPEKMADNGGWKRSDFETIGIRMTEKFLKNLLAVPRNAIYYAENFSYQRIPGRFVRLRVFRFYPLSYYSQEIFVSEFNGVTILKKANIYSDGKVTSRTVLFADGSRKTLGIMLPGEYTFSTGLKEIMEILSGDLEVLLPASDDWITLTDGAVFEVPANAAFSLKVKKLTDYCCSYVE